MNATLARVAAALLVLTFLDDGLREWRSFSEQIGYLTSPANNIELSWGAAALYVTFSLCAQLGGSVVILGCALLSPGALTPRAGPPDRRDFGLRRRARAAELALAVFVASAIVVYGVGQPASQHAQGRLVFILRNLGILGGVVLLLAEGDAHAGRRAALQLAARLLLAAHGLEVAPAESWLALSLADLLALPPTALLAAGLRTREAAAALAMLLAVSDLGLNHYWYGFRYNDNIRYYFFEDCSIIGGLLLLAATTGGAPHALSLDAWRDRQLQLRGGAAADEQRRLMDEELDLGEADPDDE